MPFAGGIDLGTLAKARNASMKATVGLAELTTTVLRRHLPKDPAIRVSTEWCNKELPATHMNYAALVYMLYGVFIRYYLRLAVPVEILWMLYLLVECKSRCLHQIKPLLSRMGT